MRQWVSVKIYLTYIVPYVSIVLLLPCDSVKIIGSNHLRDDPVIPRCTLKQDQI